MPITENWRIFFEKCDEMSGQKRDTSANELALCAKKLVDSLGNEEKE